MTLDFANNVSKDALKTEETNERKNAIRKRLAILQYQMQIEDLKEKIKLLRGK